MLSDSPNVTGLGCILCPVFRKPSLTGKEVESLSQILTTDCPVLLQHMDSYLRFLRDQIFPSLAILLIHPKRTDVAGSLELLGILDSFLIKRSVSFLNPRVYACTSFLNSLFECQKQPCYSLLGTRWRFSTSEPLLNVSFLHTGSVGALTPGTLSALQ